LLKLNEVWEKAKIRIHSIVRNFEEKGIMEAGISQLLPISRINAEINIILNKKGTTFKEILMRESSSADLVFLGLMRSEMKDAQANATRIKDLSQGLKTAVFVQNNSIPGTVPILLRL
jgi:hypothetical protein